MTNQEINDVFRDILKHTHGLGIFEMVAIEGDEETTSLRSVDHGTPVVMKGELKTPMEDFANVSIGLNRMNVLAGYLKYDDFNNEDAEVTIKSENRNGVVSPVEIQFKSVGGTNALYRFMLPEVVKESIDNLQFTGIDKFDIEISPSTKNIKDMNYFSSVLGSYEDTFVPKTENGNLYFYIGQGKSDRARIHIEDNIDGTLSSGKCWPLGIILKILRLGDNGYVKMSIHDKGMIQIVVDGFSGRYTYYLPGKSV